MITGGQLLTEDLVTHVVLLDEIAQQLLVNTSTINNLDHISYLRRHETGFTVVTYCCIPERTSKFDSLEEYRLSFLQRKVAAHAMAQSHSAISRS